jgi:hypothetical protein
MVTPAFSLSSDHPDPNPSGWLKVGAVAVSVLAGSLVAVWWHRNTLKKLQQAVETDKNPYFGSAGANTDES